MNAKIILVVCASALLVQTAVGQCIGRFGGGFGRCGGCGYGGLGYGGLGYGGLGYGGLGYGGLGYGGFGYDGLGYGGYGGRLGCDIGLAGALGASYGGGLGVASASAVPPVGLGVTSENVYEGCVDVVGNLPFLGTVGVEGIFPTAGAGVINYGCGDGAVGITAEGGYGAGYGLGYGAGYELGYGGYGLGGCGCGCGCGSYL